jgi:hypothetical protein
MTLKLYQAQVLVGVLLIILIEGALVAGRPSLANSLVELIEGAGFLFCCAGVVAGAREARTAFDALGRDKAAAKRDLDFMRARVEVQAAAVAATAAVGLVAARRFGIGPLVPLAGAGLLGVSLPFLNRATGWSRRA